MHLAYNSRIPLRFVINCVVWFLYTTAIPAAVNSGGEWLKTTMWFSFALLLCLFVQHSNLDAALLLISNNSSGLSEKKSGPCHYSNRASEMLEQTQHDQQGHKERHFLHISFINIMKSPSEGGKGRKGQGTGGVQQWPFSPGLT